MYVMRNKQSFMDLMTKRLWNTGIIRKKYMSYRNNMHSTNNEFTLEFRIPNDSYLRQISH